MAMTSLVRNPPQAGKAQIIWDITVAHKKSELMLMRHATASV